MVNRKTLIDFEDFGVCKKCYKYLAKVTKSKSRKNKIICINENCEDFNK